MNDYNLNETKTKNINFLEAARGINKFLKGEKTKILFALMSVLISSAISIYTPFLIGDAIDKYIVEKDSANLLRAVLVLLGLYLIGFVTSYIQILFMGSIGQNILFRIRNELFSKLQSLPISFFNSNKSGDLISRINSDTDTLNQTFSETLIRFVGNFFVIVGIALMMFNLNLRLAIAATTSTVFLIIITSLISPKIKTINKKGLDSLGDLSAEIQQSLQNFKVIVAFNRRDYFQTNFKQANDKTKKAYVKSNIANTILIPLYDYAGNIALLLVIVVGLNLILEGAITIGLLITFISYTNRFYQPLRILASLFTSIQTGLASWTRLDQIMNLKNSLKVIPSKDIIKSQAKIKFDNVSFGYEKNKFTIENVNFEMFSGKTYAFVGPTGGGKSTTASLIARLYDPSKGNIYLDGRDIRSIQGAEISKKIGFILQEPYLFTGNIGDNIKYGNDEISHMNNKQLIIHLQELGLQKVLDKFKEGLDTKISGEESSISLGQKQLVAFLRVILRKPEILILDEATANIDTITESLLQEIIKTLSKDTTKIVIAHRLNTIKDADEILFVAGGQVEKTISFDQTMNKINTQKLTS